MNPVISALGGFYSLIMMNPPLPNSSQTWLGVLCGAGAGALWGLVFLAPELVREFGPVHLTLGRYLFFGIIAAGLLAKRLRYVTSRLTAREWKTLCGLALIGNILYYALLSAAVQLGGVATTSLVIGFLPVVVTIIGSRERQAIPLEKLTVSLLLCVGGALCVGRQAVWTPGTEAQNSVVGLLCAVGALISWTWFAVTNSRWLERIDGLTPTDWNLLSGVVSGGLALLGLPVAAFFDSAGHPASDWIKLVAVSTGIAYFASIVGNALWNKMSRLLPLTLVGQMILFETLFALLYGFAWERRGPTELETIAFVLISLSVISCLAAHQPKAQEF